MICVPLSRDYRSDVFHCHLLKSAKNLVVYRRFSPKHILVRRKFSDEKAKEAPKGTIRHNAPLLSLIGRLSSPAEGLDERFVGTLVRRDLNH